MCDKPQIFTKCCKPLGQGKCSKTLRNILPWMLKKKSSLNLNQKICDSCRTKLRILNDVVELSVVPDSTELETDEPFDSDRTYDYESDDDYYNSKRAKRDPPYVSKEIAINLLNRLLLEFGEPPVDVKRLSQKNYCREKVASIANILKSNIFTGHPPDEHAYDNDGKVMLEQLKEKFRSSTKQSEKTSILTLLPRNWSIMKIMAEFEGTSKRFQLTYVSVMSNVLLIVLSCVYCLRFVSCQLYIYKYID